MKRLALLAVLAVAVMAVGATQYTRILNLQVAGKTLLGTTTEANAITRSLVGSATLNYASTTITCLDSTGITVTGAKTGDVCVMGIASTIIGAGTGLNGTTQCYVSADDEVKIRRCSVGTADNPPDALWRFRVFSSQ